MTGVTVVDYDSGNLLSVRRALEHCGAEVDFADSPEGVLSADRLVLPGVGSFGDAMDKLRQRNLIQPLKEYAATDRPFLGICVGMQILFDWGLEFGEREGIGLIPGSVPAVPDTGADGGPHKVPHIGWSELIPPDSSRTWEDTVLAGLERPVHCYFVHSFAAVPENDDDLLATCDYDGRRITAAAGRNNLVGCQFHPEKSGEAGLRILSNFLAPRMT